MSYAAGAANLDRRLKGNQFPITWTGVVAGAQTWTVPYSIATDGSQGVLAVARISTGELLASTRPSATEVRVTTSVDLSADVYVGILYPQTYEFSTVYYRRDGVPDTRGRLNLTYASLLFSEANDITIEVTPQGRSTYTYVFRSAAGQNDGRFKFPVQARNEGLTIKLTNSKPGACRIVGLDWEGNYTTRSRRL
jgi:hypothetical protein